MIYPSIEEQIANLAISMPGASFADMNAAFASQFPTATDDQINRGCLMAAEVLEALAEACEAEAEPYKAELARRQVKP